MYQIRALLSTETTGDDKTSFDAKVAALATGTSRPIVKRECPSCGWGHKAMYFRLRAGITAGAH
jgi:hypothetical protein